MEWRDRFNLILQKKKNIFNCERTKFLKKNSRKISLNKLNSCTRRSVETFSVFKLQIYGLDDIYVSRRLNQEIVTLF